MATLDDLEAGVFNSLAGIVFAGQSYLEDAVANVVSPWQGSPGAAPLTVPVRLYVGSPEIEALQSDVSTGITNIAIAAVPNMSRNSMRFLPYADAISANQPSLLLSWSPAGVVFGGTGGTGQVVGVAANKIAYAYRLLSTDTPATVAAALAAVIPGATASGAVLTAQVVGGAVVVCDQTQLLHVGQNQQMVQVSILAAPISGSGGSGPAVRAAVARVVDGLKAILTENNTVTRFIGMPDGSAAQILFQSQADDDKPRGTNIWRRIMLFRCDYDDTVSQTLPAMITTSILVKAGVNSIFWAGNAPAQANIITDANGNVLVDDSGNYLGTF